MSRGLTANELAVLARTQFKVETLLELNFPSETLYYTTGEIPVSITTPTSGGSQTYTTRSFLNDLGAIKETFQPLPVRVNLGFERLSDGGSDDDFLSYLTADCINSQVVMYKLFRDLTDNSTEDSDGLLQIFNGKISGVEDQVSLDRRIIVVRCTSDFGDYDSIRGVNSSELFVANQNRVIQWGGFVFE